MGYKSILRLEPSLKLLYPCNQRLPLLFKVPLLAKRAAVDGDVSANVAGDGREAEDLSFAAAYLRTQENIVANDLKRVVITVVTQRRPIA